MKTVEAHHKLLFRHVRDNLGGSPRMTTCRFGEDDHDEPFDLAIFDDVPVPEVTTYVTIGLSDAFPPHKRVRFEIVAACVTRMKKFQEVVMFAAHLAREQPERFSPGSLREKIVSSRYSGASAAHLLLTETALSGRPIPEISLPKLYEVRPLYAVPITSEELIHAQESSIDSLIQALGKSSGTLFDLDRPSLCFPRKPVDFASGMTMWRGKLVPKGDHRK